MKKKKLFIVECQEMCQMSESFLTRNDWTQKNNITKQTKKKKMNERKKSNFIWYDVSLLFFYVFIAARMKRDQINKKCEDRQGN